MSAIISTLGRCGSTYLKRNFIRNNVQLITPWNHYYPQEIQKIVRKNPKVAKVVFLFGDPYEIILSIKKCEYDIGPEMRAAGMKVEGKVPGIKWIKNHFRNLKADFNHYTNICDVDALKLERMYDLFMRCHAFPMLSLRYEKLYENVDIIQKFLGQPFNLGEPYRLRIPRFDGLSEKTQKRLENTYGKFRNKIMIAPDAKIWKAK